MARYRRLILMELEKLSRMLAAGYSLRATAHALERAGQENGTATVLTVKHAEAPLRTQRHACHN